MAGRLLTKREAAEQLSCSASTINRLLAAGRLPGLKLGQRSVRIAAEAVASYAATLPRAAYRQPAGAAR